MDIVKIKQFFDKNDLLFETSETINVNQLILDLPAELDTDAKKNFLKKFGKNINKEQYILFLRHMKHGGDHISMDYLFAHYGLEISPVTNVPMFNNEFKYSDIVEEAFYMWYMIRLIKLDPFVGKYFNDQSKFLLVRQQHIEQNILKTTSNSKFDFSLLQIDSLFEIHEYYHETNRQRAKDIIKNNLATLCGYRVIALRVKNVFDMTKSEFKKLSMEQVHDTLYNSKYLKELSTDFIKIITSTLLKFEDVRSDYIMFLFKKMLNERIIDNTICINATINEINNLTTKDMQSYLELQELLISYKSSYSSTKTILSDLRKSDHFINLFNIKDRCVKSTDKTIITYGEVFKLFNTKNTKKFKNFIKKNICRNSVRIGTILITWEELSEIIYKYDSNSDLNIMLQMYYREVGRSYEIIIKMMQSHTDELISNQSILSSYITHVVKKLKILGAKVVSKIVPKPILPKAKFVVIHVDEIVEHVEFIEEIKDPIMEALAATFKKNLKIKKPVIIDSDGSDSELSDND
jgi:hypothetical protein